MFGMSGTEIAVLLVLALLILGPTKLPSLARMVGKGIREFRRATDDLRYSVENEFYRRDQPSGPARTPDSPPPTVDASPTPSSLPAPSPEPAPASVSEAAEPSDPKS